MEHAGYSNALADDTKLQDYVRMNEGAKKAFEELQAQGIKDIYYLTREELGLHPDAWVDYVHPSDWGMENTSERRRAESTGDITHPQRRPLYHNACHPAPGTQ